MTKKNFITLLIGTVGGILFALGMCMALIPEWNALTQGVAVGCVGLVVLIVMIFVRRKMEGKSIIVKLTAKTIGTILLSAAGAAALGLGMCLIMVWNSMVSGIVLGTVGIVLLLCLIPLVKGLK